MFTDVARVSSITKNMIMPTNSSVIYNTTTNTYEYYDGVAWVPFTNFQSTGEPTGFPLGSDGQIDLIRSTLSFNNDNRNFTIAPTNDFFYFYHNGREFKKVNPESIQIDDTEGLHYIYFDKEGILKKSTTFSYDIILKNVFVAIIYWNFTNKKYLYVGDERHGCTMDAHTHARIHAESGAVYVSGMTPNFLYSGNSVVDGTGNSNINISFGVSEGVFRDEDIIHSCTLTEFNINMPIFYRETETTWRRAEGGESQVSYRLMYENASSKIVYNKKINGNFSLVTPNSGNFVLYHLYAINDANINKSGNNRDNKYILIAGTQEYQTKSDAKYNAINEISQMDNFPFIESVAIGTFIYEHNVSYTNIAKARLVSIDGENFIDWRKKINLKPLTALANSHNYNGGIYGQAPYYHSNQPISTTDDVIFKNVSVNNLKIRTGSSIIANGTINLSGSSSLIYNMDMTTNYQSTVNITNGIPGEIFYIRIKNGQTPYNWGSNVKWLSESKPLPNINNRFDVYSFICFQNDLYYGSVFSSNYTNFTATGGYIETIDKNNSESENIDLSIYSTNCFKIQNPGYINLINGVEGRWYTLLIVSDGNYRFGSNCNFPLQNAQPIPSAIGHIDIYSFICINSKFLSTFAYGYVNI